LTAAGSGTVSGTACEVTFELTNRNSAQASPAVSVSAEIEDGSGNSVGSIASAEMTKPGTALYGVSDGADPLTVVVPSFTLKSIRQSTPGSGATNTLTVSLTADFDLPAGSTVTEQSTPFSGANNELTVNLTSNCDLPEGSKVTITGLTGSATDTSATLSVQSTSDKLGAQGNWNKDGALILTAASGGVLVGVSVEVKFNLSNPSTGYTSPSVSVEAAIEFSGTAVGTIQRVSMTKPNSTLFGVAHGRNPLQVLVPDLTVKTIQQSTPFSGANNELTVNLTSNCDLPEGSKVTITGLTGSATDTSATLSVQSTSDKLGAQGNWNKDGALILTAASGGVLVGVSVEVKFNLSNPSTGYTSPSVSVEAAIEFSGTAVGTIQRVSMTKPNSTLFGVAHGRNPLQVLVPDLTVKTIQQSTPFSGANNELTVNLTSNCDLPEGSKVTITGLTGSATDTSATLSVQSTSDKLGAQGNWNKDGALILTAASGGVLVGVSVEVKFNLSNPSTGYTSPSVSVEAAIEFSGTAVGTIQRVSMTKPNSTLFGVAHGRNPLQVLVPDLTVKTIQQSTPFSGANNELTVNLTSNCDLPEGSKVTITGLTGSSGNSVGSIASAGDDKPGTALYGVANGADPLTVVVPSFTLKSIRQSTPGSGATNTLTVSLTADFDLPAGSTVTITGLTGSQTADSASVTVTSTGGLLGSSGAWTQSSGQLVLTAAGSGTVSGTACEVTFELTNRNSAQASPAVSVSAEIEDGSGNSVGSIASAEMTKPSRARRFRGRTTS
jgi:hypothetical protein